MVSISVPPRGVHLGAADHVPVARSLDAPEPDLGGDLLDTGDRHLRGQRLELDTLRRELAHGVEPCLIGKTPRRVASVVPHDAHEVQVEESDLVQALLFDDLGDPSLALGVGCVFQEPSGLHLPVQQRLRDAVDDARVDGFGGTFALPLQHGGHLGRHLAGPRQAADRLQLADLPGALLGPGMGEVALDKHPLEELLPRPSFEAAGCLELAKQVVTHGPHGEHGMALCQRQPGQLAGLDLAALDAGQGALRLPRLRDGWERIRAHLCGPDLPCRLVQFPDESLPPGGFFRVGEPGHGPQHVPGRLGPVQGVVHGRDHGSVQLLVRRHSPLERRHDASEVPGPTFSDGRLALGLLEVEQFPEDLAHPLVGVNAQGRLGVPVDGHHDLPDAPEGLAELPRRLTQRRVSLPHAG